jgi:adenylate kinase
MLNIALFGPPGAGKGTQSKFLIEKYNLTYISTGDILRKEIAEKSDLGMRAKEIIERGELAPDDLIVKIIEKRIENQRTAGILFDGFPRTIVQAYILDGLLQKLNTSLTCMLSLEVPYDELKKRLIERGKSSGRSDDNIKVIERRLEEYEKKTLPLVDFYKERSKFIPINGVGSIDEITTRLDNAVHKVLKPSYFNIIVSGKPGSGRGTQAKKIADKYGLVYISTGKFLRNEIDAGTELGKRVKPYMESGTLVPDEFPIRIIEEQIKKNPEANGFVFKGFPRNTVQAYIMDGLLSKINSKVNCVLELDIPLLDSIKRLSERSKTHKARFYDMNTDVIIHRMEEWEETIKKDMRDYYERVGKHCLMDAKGSPEEVFERISKRMEEELKINPVK